MLLSIFSSRPTGLKKKHFLRSFVVVSIVLSCLFVVEFFLRLDKTPKALPFRNTRAGILVDQMHRQGTRYDIIAVGSSRCATNFDVQAFLEENPTLTAFNAGLHNMPMQAYLEFTERFFLKRAKKEIMLLISPKDLNIRETDAFESYGFRFFSGQKGLMDSLLMKLHLFKYRLQYKDTFYLYQLFRNFRVTGYGIRDFSKNGFEPVSDSHAKQKRLAVTAKKHLLEQAHFDIEPAAILRLREFVAKMETAGLEVSVAWTPQLSKLSFEDEAAGFRKLSGVLVGDIGIRPEKIFYKYDAVDLENLFDGEHLTAAGASRFSRALGNAYKKVP